MNRTNKSALIAVSSTLNNLMNSIIGLILTSLIIKTYGSDFNGLTATSTQFVNMLLIVEGGFTTAINVALFQPYVNNDIDMISKIRFSAETKFKKIGILFLVIGILSSIVYAFFIKTSYDYLFTLSIFIIAIIPVFLNIYSSLKWKILFQMEQKDYIINGISLVITLVTFIINICIVFSHGTPILIRLVMMFFSILNITLVCQLGKRRFSHFTKKVPLKKNLIKGVNDVFVLNLTGVIYASFPILYITATAGTTMASVYAVYNGIFMIIKSIVTSVMRAPTIALGQLINEDIKRARTIFKSYQFSSFFMVIFFLSVTMSLAIPFVSLMTKGNTDIEYKNFFLLFSFSAIFLLESIHIPSGQMIIMSGRYKLCKRIQLIALFTIGMFSFIGNIFFGVYGTIIAVFLAALVLCLLEVYFNYKLILKESVNSYIKLFAISILTIVINLLINSFISIEINDYFDFILMGIVYSIIDIIITYVIFNIFSNTECQDIVRRFKSILYSIKNKLFGGDQSE